MSDTKGSVFIGNLETGEFSELGWIDIDGGLSTLEEPSTATVPSLQEMSVSFEITGRTAEKTMRILMGLPYKHPRQILHNGRKP